MKWILSVGGSDREVREHLPVHAPPWRGKLLREQRVDGRQDDHGRDAPAVDQRDRLLEAVLGGRDEVGKPLVRRPVVSDRERQRATL